MKLTSEFPLLLSIQSCKVGFLGEVNNVPTKPMHNYHNALKELVIHYRVNSSLK